MKLKFKVQPYQTHAVDALADSFAGQPKSGEVRRGG
jgi:type III restriction enzyme